MEEGINRNKILLLEDDIHLRRGISLALELHQFEVHQVSNGMEGIRALDEVIPDLILSDINMPLMNGLQFFKELRNDPRWTQIPFVFLTGNDATQDIQAGHELGVDDYITKPIQTENLLRIINARLLRSAEIKAFYLNEAFLQTVKVLANTIEGKDRYTHGHVERVAQYALWFGEALEWTETQMWGVQYGARLHDIGKITIPDHVLNKPGPLTPEEWQQIKEHPQEGVRIIGEISLMREALPYIRSHHERWDGAGYPDGLSGVSIPIEGRMLAIVDVFDALTTDRPYRSALTVDEAKDYIISKAGIEFDPSLVSIFTDIVESKIRIFLTG
ncbi:MAG TPA: HD domain-containing phosphohydrolase [Anaerolineales bacterium]|nr:HD domain-containing phosphohydrolase [Anaerolineales bacterium]